MGKKEQIQELKNQAKEVLQTAKEQQAKLLKEAKLKQEKLLKEAEQLETQIKIQMADKAILFFKNEISLDELNNFIQDNYELI